MHENGVHQLIFSPPKLQSSSTTPSSDRVWPSNFYLSQARFVDPHFASCFRRTDRIELPLTSDESPTSFRCPPFDVRLFPAAAPPMLPSRLAVSALSPSQLGSATTASSPPWLAGPCACCLQLEPRPDLGTLGALFPLHLGVTQVSPVSPCPTAVFGLVTDLRCCSGRREGRHRVNGSRRDDSLPLR